MTTIHHPPVPGATPFFIYEDPENLEPPSPSEVDEGDVSFISDMSMPGADVAMPSIEGEHDLEEEPEPYSSTYTSRPSLLSSGRRTSGITTNSFVSSLPSEISVASKPVAPANAVESRYSPRKERPPFRNPSSVRAMQMASPPPLPGLEPPRERGKGNYKLATPSRSGRSDSVSTTGTRHSRRHRDSLSREHQAHQSPRPAATPQPLPLVLLHVTILPMQMPYTPDIMIRIMPEWLVENYKILEEKLQDIVLMRRGLLIPHPRDEYDLLEERILESLELKTPRLLKCGHFVPPDLDDEETLGDDEESRIIADDSTGRGSRMSGGTITAEDDAGYRYPTPNSDDSSTCVDCHRQVKKPGHGVGTGTKRWDIKIYAANGLMRAGAWSAAWSEMERCDVEVSPWIPNEVRKALEKRLEQEHQAAKVKAMYTAELQRQIEEETAMKRKLEEEAEAKRRVEEAEVQNKFQSQAAALLQRLEEEATEKRRLEDTLNDKIEEAKEVMRLEFEAQALAEANCVAERFRVMETTLKSEREKAAAQAPRVLEVPRVSSRSSSRSQQSARSRSCRPRMEDVPLGTLLKNYFVLQLQDSRNFFILILGTLVVFLLMNSNPSWNLHQPTPDITAVVPLDVVTESIAPSVLTSIATMTSTSTLMVTEVQTLDGAQQTLPPAGAKAVEEKEEEEGVTMSVISPEEDGKPAGSISHREEPAIVTLSPAETDDGSVDPAQVVLEGLTESLPLGSSMGLDGATLSDESATSPRSPLSSAAVDHVDPESFASEGPEVSLESASSAAELPTSEDDPAAEIQADPESSATGHLEAPLESALHLDEDHTLLHDASPPTHPKDEL